MIKIIKNYVTALIRNTTGSYSNTVGTKETVILPDEVIKIEANDGEVLNTISNPLYEDVVIDMYSVTKSGILYRYPLFQGQQISYAVGDAGWHFQNGTYDYTAPTSPETITALDLSATNPFTTLKENNIFGNKERFTDELGTQEYANEVIVCHLTGLMYLVRDANTSSNFTNVDWSTAINNANNYVHNSLGYNDWRIMSSLEGFNLVDYEDGILYNPFNTLLSSQEAPWVSNVRSANANNTRLRISFNSGALINHNINSTSYYFLVRNHLI